MAQKPLQMALKSGAGDKLHFLSMSAHEEVSRLFEYQIIAVSEDGNLSADDVLGKPIGVSLELGNGKTRWFQGLATSFGIEGGEGRSVSYRITARPWMWLLTRSADVRIFQDKSVPDIIKSIFEKYQGSVKISLTGTHKPRPYCVQYRETDFNFVCRLMEEEGIFFWFEHTDAKHNLVLADGPSAHAPTPGFEKVIFRVHQAALDEQAAIHE